MKICLSGYLLLMRLREGFDKNIDKKNVQYFRNVLLNALTDVLYDTGNSKKYLQMHMEYFMDM